MQKPGRSVAMLRLQYAKSFLLYLEKCRVPDFGVKHIRLPGSCRVLTLLSNIEASRGSLFIAKLACNVINPSSVRGIQVAVLSGRMLEGVKEASSQSSHEASAWRRKKAACFGHRDKRSRLSGGLASSTGSRTPFTELMGCSKLQSVSVPPLSRLEASKLTPLQPTILHSGTAASENDSLLDHFPAPGPSAAAAILGWGRKPQTSVHHRAGTDGGIAAPAATLKNGLQPNMQSDNGSTRRRHEESHASDSASKSKLQEQQQPALQLPCAAASSAAVQQLQVSASQ